MRAWVWRARPIERVVLAGVLAYAALLVGFPDALRRYPLAAHFHYQDKHLYSPGHVLAAVPLLLCVLLLALTLRRARRALPAGRPAGGGRRGTVLLLFLCAVGLQWSFSFLDEGLSARRMTSTLLDPHYGHSEFAVIAYGEEDPLALARDYERRCATDDWFVFARSKPPGHLLFYVLGARLYHDLGLEGPAASLGSGAGFYDREPLTAFGGFLAIVFTLVAGLPVAVLWKAGELLGGRPVGLWCGVTFLLCPSVLLVTMHMDQVLYPLLVALTFLLALLSVRRSPFCAVAAAFVLYLSIYTSFSLLFLVPAVLLGGGSLYLVRARLRRRVLSALLVGTIGLVLWHVLFRAILNFDLAAAYQRSMELHAAWRRTEGLVGPAQTFRNLIELARWVGLPAAIVYAWYWARIVRKLWKRRRPLPLDVFVLLYPLLVLAVSTFGHTVDEIGRLFIPLMIPVLVAVAVKLAGLYRRRPAWAYIASALVMIWLVKNFHDFQ